MSSSVLKCISSALIQSLHSFSISDLFTQEYNPHSQEIYNLVGDCHRYCGFSSDHCSKADIAVKQVT